MAGRQCPMTSTPQADVDPAVEGCGGNERKAELDDERKDAVGPSSRRTAPPLYAQNHSAHPDGWIGDDLLEGSVVHDRNRQNH